MRRESPLRDVIERERIAHAATKELLRRTRTFLKEHSHNGDGECRECFYDNGEGHSVSCPLGILLRELEGV